MRFFLSYIATNIVGIWLYQGYIPYTNVWLNKDKPQPHSDIFTASYSRQRYLVPRYYETSATGLS